MKKLITDNEKKRLNIYMQREKNNENILNNKNFVTPTTIALSSFHGRYTYVVTFLIIGEVVMRLFR